MVCIGPFYVCIQKILDLGWEVFTIGGTFLNRGKGLSSCKLMSSWVAIKEFNLDSHNLDL